MNLHSESTLQSPTAPLHTQNISSRYLIKIYVVSMHVHGLYRNSPCFRNIFVSCSPYETYFHENFGTACMQVTSTLLEQAT